LLDSFTPDEIEVIFAHEIGHHVIRTSQINRHGRRVYAPPAFGFCDATRL